MDIEPLHDLDEIVPILIDAGLETADIDPVAPPQFYGVRDAGVLIAVVGLEMFGASGLLRSLVVVPLSQGGGLARGLVAFVEARARSCGMTDLFLLTTSAAGLFVKIGYAHTPRAVAPPAISATPQFSSLCPSTSAFMHKALAGA